MGKGSRNRKERESRGSGYRFNSTERKLVDMEIRKSILEQERRMSLEVDAAWLMQLYERYDWTPEQLREIYDSMAKDHQKIRERYEMEECSWIYVQKMKEAGMDIASW